MCVCGGGGVFVTQNLHLGLMCIHIVLYNYCYDCLIAKVVKRELV